MDEKSIKKLSIKGFKSIKNLENFPLRDINILIGSNGSGKSNFISYFSMMKELLNGRLQFWTAKQGSADRIVSFGIGETDSINSVIEFSRCSYGFRIETTAGKGFSFVEENIFAANHQLSNRLVLGTGHNESMLKKGMSRKKEKNIIQPVWEAISGWMIFHFHNTTQFTHRRNVHKTLIITIFIY